MPYCSKDKNIYEAFTLIEILVVVGLIAILAAITIVALNPAKMFANSRNVERWNNLRAINDALEQWIVDGNAINALTEGDGSAIAKCGSGTTAIMDQPTVLDGEIDLDDPLVSIYLVAIPRDPNFSSGTYTGYRMCRFTNPLRYLITAPGAELGEIIALPTLPAGYLGQGLVGYWPMDETAPNTCSGGEDSCDHSGNDFHMNWNNETTFTSGKFGNGTTYDGVNDSAACPEGVCGGIGNLDFNYNDSFTYSAWFRTTNSSIQTLIIGKKGRNLVALPGYMMSIFSSGIVSCWLADGSAQIVPWGTSVNNDGNWHHAACVYDGNAKTYKLYVDGQYEWDPTSSNNDVTLGGISGNFDSGWGFHTGLMTANSAFDFNGDIDEVRVYNRALNEEEIDDLYKLTPPD